MDKAQAKQLEEIHRIVKKELKPEVTRLADLMDGNPEKGVNGLRNRLDTVEESQEEIIEERNRLVNYVRGGLLGLGLNVIGMVVLVITVARLLIEVGGP